jgi:hypothetical protein
MSIAERLSSTKTSFGIPAPGENVLLAVVACAILSFHVFVGVMVHSALPIEPVAQLEQAISFHGD